jgi:tetratricopeptide (TPR) repeat protein
MNEQNEEALLLIRQCIGTDSVDYRLFLLQGKIYENLHQYRPAMVSYNYALKLNEDNPDSKSSLAALYLKTGQPAVSEKLYAQLVEANPEVSRWKIKHANTLQILGKHEQSLRLLRDVISKDSLNWEVHRDMGNCYFKLNIFDSAVLCFEKSLNIYPNSTSSINLMKISIKQKDYIKAIETGYEAAQIDSTKVEIWENIGLAFFLMDLHPYSIKMFNKILELGDTTYTTANHLGYLYYATEDYAQAVKYLEIALKQQPDELGTMYLLAKSCELLTEFEKSISTVNSIRERVKQLDSLAVRAEIVRGNVFREQQHYEEAIKTYSAVLKADPSHTNLNITIAKIYDVNLQNKKEAINWYRRYLNKVFPEWEIKEPKQKIHLQVKNRIEQLKTDLFYEEPEKK